MSSNQQYVVRPGRRTMRVCLLDLRLILIHRAVRHRQLKHGSAVSSVRRVGVIRIRIAQVSNNSRPSARPFDCPSSYSTQRDGCPTDVPERPLRTIDSRGRPRSGRDKSRHIARYWASANTRYAYVTYW